MKKTTLCRLLALLLTLSLLAGVLAGCTAAPASSDSDTPDADTSQSEPATPADDTQPENTDATAQSESTDAADAAQPADAPYTFTDVLGHEVTLTSWQRVASLYGSFAETWMLAGGSLVGVTSDAVEERALDLGEDVAIVGTVKEANLEEILAVQPDFLILSADTPTQVDLHEALTAAGIPHAYYRVDTFEEYLAMLQQFCTLTGRQDLYEQNGEAVRRQIDTVLAAVEGQPAPSVLLLRAFSSGAKAKGDDNLTGVILRDLGADNLVTRHESLLEDISLEEIIDADPDYIFVTIMGASEDKALGYLAENLESSPAWQGLTAVQNDHYILLPKDLFHYKPNARWGESYVYLAKILYPQLADTLE